MKKRQALTMLELILSIAIVALLLSIAALGILRYKSRLELKTAEQILIQGLRRVRSEARVSSLDQEISFLEHSFVVKNKNFEKEYSLGNVRLTKLKGSKTLKYSAPYGKTGAGNFEFELSLQNGSKTGVYVFGVTGKVAGLD